MSNFISPIIYQYLAMGAQTNLQQCCMIVIWPLNWILRKERDKWKIASFPKVDTAPNVLKCVWKIHRTKNMSKPVSCNKWLHNHSVGIDKKSGNFNYFRQFAL